MDESTAYRRSNLREVLLARAVSVLEERGASALSLRELARDVGVSHAAPARHFADREQLLQALAVEGFRQLEGNLRDAVATDVTTAEQARRAAHAYIDFAIERANLAEVMYRHEGDHDRSAIGASATAAFEPLLLVFQRAEDEGAIGGGDAAGVATLFLATLQGLAALVNCAVVPPEAASGLVDDALPRFIAHADA